LRAAAAPQILPGPTSISRPPALKPLTADVLIKSRPVASKATERAAAPSRCRPRCALMHSLAGRGRRRGVAVWAGREQVPVGDRPLPRAASRGGRRRKGPSVQADACKAQQAICVLLPMPVQFAGLGLRSWRKLAIAAETNTPAIIQMTTQSPSSAAAHAANSRQ
jgi:hypothetical protein